MSLPKNIFFVGIGGIGMSALAQALAHAGAHVSGSDRDESPVVTMLAEKGITVAIGQDACNIPADTELLVYSDAITQDNVERARGRDMNIPELSYFEALGEFSKNMRTIAVAGTHGKTTTTGMLAKILQYAGKRPTAIVGSIVRDFESNFLAGTDDVFVVEACEYRNHLLKLSPKILVINNIELDHTDYFPDLATLQNTFRIAAEKVPADGYIITNPRDPVIAAVLENVSAAVIDYTREAVPALSLIGEFNSMNARAAKCAARAAFPVKDTEVSHGASPIKDAGITDDVIDEALVSFKGSWRRFEYRGETPLGALVYDDYAHHPTAIAKTIEGAREKFLDKKIVVAFHPHLFSRTKSFLYEFADALATADAAIVAPIYAAREVTDPSVSNHILAEEITKRGGEGSALDSFDLIRDELLKCGDDTLIITMGAGDIYKVAEQITD